MNKLENINKYYGEGQQAYMAGKPITFNPYPLSVWNPYHNLWRRGWQDTAKQMNSDPNSKYMYQL